MKKTYLHLSRSTQCLGITEMSKYYLFFFQHDNIRGALKVFELEDVVKS